MTMGSRPSRRRLDRMQSFINEVSASETEQLHCTIPSETHRRLRVLAAQEGTTITNLVRAAIDDLLSVRGE